MERAFTVSDAPRRTRMVSGVSISEKTISENGQCVKL